MLILNSSSRESGRRGSFLADTASPPNHDLERVSAEIHKQFGIYADGPLLPSQWGLCPRGLVGADRRVRRGPSLGELTPAGASNSQVTLHSDQATDDEGILSLRLFRNRSLTPIFSFTPSDSGMTLKELYGQH